MQWSQSSGISGHVTKFMSRSTCAGNHMWVAIGRATRVTGADSLSAERAPRLPRNAVKRGRARPADAQREGEGRPGMSRLAALVSTMVLAESASPRPFPSTADAETPAFAGHCVAIRRVHKWCARRTSGMVRVVCFTPQRSVEGFASDINKVRAMRPRERARRRFGLGKNKLRGRSGVHANTAYPDFGRTGDSAPE